MNKALYHTIIFFLLVIHIACDNREGNVEVTPSKVEIKQVDGVHRFFINDQPFEVRGVGLDFDQIASMNRLKQAGANSFRTWGTNNAKQELDSAAKYGLMVALGLDMEKELHGFDYNNDAKVKEQFNRLKERILLFKDHPNLLCWVVGNELNLLFDNKGQLKLVNPKAYEALADLVDFIHEVDPNHPVTTTFAGVHKSHIDLALKHVPQLDFLSYQVYGDLMILPDLVNTAEVEYPYMVTEYGPMGHWERPSTEWGREIEETSSEKAKGYITRINKGILDDKSGLCLGSYAFYWGQKQERTPTWYGMFLKTGEPTEVIDELTKLWTGTYPENRAPSVTAITFNSQKATDNIYVDPKSSHSAKIEVMDPDSDELEIEWVIRKEVMVRSEGGAFEKEPETIQFEKEADEHGTIKFVVPEEKGDYRLFAYVRDSKGKAGYANIPFYVK